MNLFYLHQTIFQNGHRVGEYIKPMGLHVSPFVGMNFSTTSEESTSKVVEIWVTRAGAVIVELEDNRWNIGGDAGCDCTLEDWPNVFDTEIEGWCPIKDFSQLPANPAEWRF